MIYQMFTLELLVAAVSMILFASVAFAALGILFYLITNAITWLKQEMKTRRNNKLRRK